MPATRAAMESSHVITGRRMQNSEMFIPPLPGITACWRRRVAAASPRRRRAGVVPGARSTAREPSVTRWAPSTMTFSPAASCPRTTARSPTVRASSTGAAARGAVRRQDEDEPPLLAGLHRGGGHGDAPPPAAVTKRDLHVLPGPEPQVRIGEARLEQDGAGVGVDGAVDEDELALGDRGVGMVGTGADDRRRAVGHRRLDLAEPALRHRELHEDRVDLGDGGERRALAGAHHVADADGQRAEAAVDLGGDGGEVEVQPGLRDLRLGGRARWRRRRARPPAPARSAAGRRSSRRAATGSAGRRTGRGRPGRGRARASPPAGPAPRGSAACPA